MKQRCFVIFLGCFLVSLMTNNAVASIYPTVSGNWADANIWDKGYVPLDDGDEIKVGKADDLTVTLNTVGLNYGVTKIDTARGCTLLIANGGYLGSGREMHIGDAGMSSSGTDVGYLTQTGGTLNIYQGASGKLQIGYGTGGNGTYTISGGSLTGSGGRMYVACSKADGSIGKVKVIGSAASISLTGDMYVANDSSSSTNNTGSATIEFELAADGTVSPISVNQTIVDSMDDAAAVANLVVTATNIDPTAPLLLIENTGTALVVGEFDTINGVAAVEGAALVVGGSYYLLTYRYAAGVDAVKNDIALLIPEPATLALLSLGMFVIRRKK